MKTTLLLACLLFPGLLLAGISDYSITSEEIQNALVLAEDNASEIQAVIDHYQDDPDTLKLRAALYLIANMDEQSYVTYRLFDTAGMTVDFDVLTYPDYDSLLTDIKQLEQNRGELDYEKVQKTEDLKTITAAYLIDQIDLAFLAWREKPWAQGIDFETFCRYILPYRGSNEPLEQWRPYFYEKYDYLTDSLKEVTDPLEAAAIINKDVRSWFGFDPRFYYHPTDQGLSEMLENGLGRCEDMTNMAIYALRANGLAVTSDYTPYWANSGNNHAWNAIVNADGDVVPFMGCEADPGKYKLQNKIGKAYRKTYEANKNNLTFQPNKQTAVPGWLKRKNYLDVTSGYTTVADIVIPLEKPVPDSVDIAYICVFNSGHWSAIHWGRIDDGEVMFSDMGTGIIYIAALYIDEDIVPWSDPFIVHNDGSLEALRASEKATTVTVTTVTNPKQVHSTDGIEENKIKPGEQYELFYWNDGWQSCGQKSGAVDAVVFDNVPDNSLLWLKKRDAGSDVRIFTYEGGQQIWW